MLSALLGSDPTSDLLTSRGDFGVAPLEAQSPAQRAYAPLPTPGGELVHDPDFALPTIAGALPWRLFYYSGLPDNTGPFGHGRRASWPLRLCPDLSGSPTMGYLVTVTLEREDGNAIQYIGNSPPNMPPPTTFTAYTPRLFDTLLYTPASFTWDETRFDTGALFHYPVGSPLPLTMQYFPVSLSYYQTVLGQRVTFQYSAGNLSSIEDPAGRQIQLGYSGAHVSSVEDWGDELISSVMTTTTTFSLLRTRPERSPPSSTMGRIASSRSPIPTALTSTTSTIPSIGSSSVRSM